MQTIPITITNRIASVPCGTCIVADNPDGYQLSFAFDGEWSEYPLKTARFLVGGEYTDVDFTGSTVMIPSMPSTAYSISVGVYAGEIATSTPAKINVMPSIMATAEGATEYDPAEPSVLPDIDELALDDTFVVTDVSEGEKARANIGQIVDYVQSAATLQPYDGDPEMDGKSSAGTSTEYARGDHIHPTDTSRAEAPNILRFNYSAPYGWTPQFSYAELMTAYTAWLNNGKEMVVRLIGGHFSAGQYEHNGEITLTHFDMVDFDYVFSDAIAVGAEDPEERGECEQIMLELHFARRIDPEEGEWIDEVSNGWLIASKLATADELAAGLEVKYTKPPGGIPTIDLADADKFNHMPESVGFGRGVVLSQPSAAGVYAVSISNYTERNGGFVAVNFNSHAVSAGASLKINSNSAHPIYHMGAAIAADIIKRSDTALLLYNASIYHLIAIDRRAKTDDIPVPSDSVPQALAETASAGDSVFYSRANHRHPLPTASDVGALPDNTTIPGALSDLTEDAAHRTVTDTEKATWGGKADKTERVTVSTAGAVSQALDAGKLYHFTGALTALTITFNSASGVAQYHFDFAEGSTAFDPSLPSSVVLPDGHTWEADTHYEVDVLNNYAVVVGWAVS